MSVNLFPVIPGLSIKLPIHQSFSLTSSAHTLLVAVGTERWGSEEQSLRPFWRSQEVHSGRKEGMAIESIAGFAEVAASGRDRNIFLCKPVHLSSHVEHLGSP